MSNDNEMLYNKYRPSKLSEVVGHASTIKDLKRRSKEGSLPRVMLFSGITGVGKTTLFRIISKNILCNTKDAEGNGCGICPICKSIDEEKISNYYFEYNASNLGIDAVRELSENAEVKSFSNAKAKVFVIDEVQEMVKAKAALNNLLKPIEKDYKNVYFIFGTMEIKSVPKAISNRCTSYQLKPHTMEDISTQLFSICQKEEVVMTTTEQADVLIAIAENSYGSMRQAISYLERVINSELWTVKQAMKELGIVTSSELNNKINALFKGKPEAFDITYSEEIVSSIKYMFGAMYKKLSNITVEEWQLQKLTGIDKSITIEQVEYALGKLFQLNTYNYISQELIDFIMIDIFNWNKKYRTMLVEMKIAGVKREDTPISIPSEPARRRGQA